MKNQLNKDQRILAKNSIYSIFITYGNYFSSMITSFLMARLISQEEWGFLIIATSYITIISLILTFLPPGLGYSLNYYIPKFLALNEKKKLKSFIKISVSIKLGFAFLVYIVSTILFFLFINFFNTNLQNYEHLLIILSPIIFISSFDKVLLDINYSFNRFNFVFTLTLIKNFFNVGALLISFFILQNVPVELIAIINVLTVLTPFIFNLAIVIIFLRHKLSTNTDEEKLSVKETIKMLSIYGSHLSTTDLINKLYNETKIQTLSFLETPQIVTGYSIANHYSEVSTGAVGSLRKPITISFSGLYAKEKYQEIQGTYKILLKFSVFIELIIMGLMILFADFYIEFIYGGSYLTFSLIFKLVMIALVFRVPGTFFFSVLKASKKVKYLVPITFTISTLRVAVFIIGLIFLGIIGALIMYILLNVIIVSFLIALTFKMLNIRLMKIKLIFQFLIFFFALGIVLILESLFLESLNYLILESLNLTFFQNLNFLSIGIFLLIYFGLNIIFRVFSQSDVEKVEILFNKDTFTHRSIRKGLKVLKKIII